MIVDSKTGISGAGRTLGLAYHFSEAAPGGALVKIGGFALQHKDAFEEEFDRIVRGIGGSEGAEVQPPEKVGTS